jgi:copper chaperone
MATYRVKGMTCQGCANAVAKAIKAEAPQASVRVDLDAGKVTVEGCDDDAKVRKAVDAAGFEFQGLAA